MIFQITYNNFEISLVVFMPNITTNHAITYTYSQDIALTIQKVFLRQNFPYNFFNEHMPIVLELSTRLIRVAINRFG